MAPARVPAGREKRFARRFRGQGEGRSSEMDWNVKGCKTLTGAGGGVRIRKEDREDGLNWNAENKVPRGRRKLGWETNGRHGRTELKAADVEKWKDWLMSTGWQGMGWLKKRKVIAWLRVSDEERGRKEERKGMWWFKSISKVFGGIISFTLFLFKIWKLFFLLALLLQCLDTR